MGATDIQIASRAAPCGCAENEIYKELAAAIRAKFLARRDLIAAGDEHALTEACNDLMDMFAHSRVLKDLIRCAFTNPSDTTGREFLRSVKAVINGAAEVEVVLALQSARKPIGECTRAGIDAAHQAVIQLRS